MSTSRKTNPATVLQLVHESRLGGHHRIVLIRSSGPDAGPWAAFEHLAEHKGYKAATTFWAGVLPVGIFKTLGVSYTEL